MTTLSPKKQAIESNIRDDSEDAKGKEKGGRWTKEEHDRFLEALKRYGKDWKKVQEFVGTGTSTQTRSHAQKYFAKCDKAPLNKMSSPIKEIGKIDDLAGVITQVCTPVPSTLENENSPKNKKVEKKLTRKKKESKKLLSFNDEDEKPLVKKKLKRWEPENNNRIITPINSNLKPQEPVWPESTTYENKESNKTLEPDSRETVLTRSRIQSVCDQDVPDFADFQVDIPKPLDLNTTDHIVEPESVIEIPRIFSADFSDIPSIIQNYR